MADSGFSQLPPGARATDSTPVQVRAELALKVVAARGEIAVLKRTARVEGEVVSITPGKVATIRTASGDQVDVQLRGRVELVQGQRVELDLPPGSPPRQVVIRPAPAPVPQAPPPPQTSAPPVPAAQTPASQASPSQPIAPGTRALLDELTPPSLARPTASPPLAALPPDTIFRLTPLPVMPPAAELLPLPVPVPALPSLAALQTPPALAARIVLAESGSLQTRPLPSIPGPPTLPQGPVPQITKPAAGTTAPPQPLHAMINGTISTPAATPAGATPRLIPIITFFPDAAQLRLTPVSLSAAGGAQTPVTPGTAATGFIPPQIDARIAAATPQGSITLKTPDGKIPHPVDAQITTPMTIDRPHATPATLQGRVIGATPQHQPILSVTLPGQAEGIPYLLQFATTALPPGTQVELWPRILQQTMAAAPAVTPPAFWAATPAAAMLPGWTWPVFDDALDALSVQGTMQAIVTQPLAKILPNPGNPAQMASAILFFVAAVRAGDINGWMGEKTIAALRREGTRGSDILAKLTREAGGMAKTMTEPVSQDWRGMALPFLWQNDVHKINLYYRHQYDDTAESADDVANRSTRFIFDLNLDRMGDVQLDGLMKSKRLDLILRTQTPFTHTMQVAMRKKYLDTLDAGSLSGDMAFQTRKDQWVRVDARQNTLTETI